MRLIDKIYSLTKKLTLLFSLLFVSCNFETLFTPSFNEPVKNYLKEYTEIAAIETYEIDFDVYQDKDGNNCVDSSADLNVTFYLRNPQNYSLVPTLTFPYIDSAIDVSGATIEQTEITVMKMKVPLSILLDTDEGHEFSPVISLLEPKSQRVFPNYTLPVYCNSKPPILYNPIILNENQHYVIAFDMPSAAELLLRHKDLVKIIINDNEYDLSVDKDGKFVFTDSKFSWEYKDSYLSISKPFTPNDRSFYFTTGEQISTNGEGKIEKIYTIELEDNAGLKTSSIANTTITKLNAPGIKDYLKRNIENGSSITMPIFSDKDYSEITVTEPTEDHEGNPVTGSTMNYALYKGTKAVARLYEKGSFTGSKVFQLPVGTWYIETYAELTNFDSSAPSKCDIRVVDSNIYISGKASDDIADGSPELPYATAKAAFDEVNSRNDESLPYVLCIMDEVDDDFNFDENLVTKELTIVGKSENASVNNITANNIVPVAVSNLTVKEKLTIANGKTILLADGAVIKDAEVSGIVQMQDSAKITGNFVLHDGCEITVTGNLTSEVAGTITTETYENKKLVLTENDYTAENASKFKIISNTEDTFWGVDTDGTMLELNPHLNLPELYTVDEAAIEDEADITLSVLENDNYTTITIVPPSKDFLDNDVTGSTVYYKIYNGIDSTAELASEGSCTEATELRLLTGTWYIEAHAEKPLVDNKPSFVTKANIRVIDPKLFVQKNATNTVTDGTTTYPYHSVADVITEINSRNDVNVDYIIYIIDDNSDEDIIFEQSLKAHSVSLQGYVQNNNQTDNQSSSIEGKVGNITSSMPMPLTITQIQTGSLTVNENITVSLKQGAVIARAVLSGTLNIEDNAVISGGLQFNEGALITLTGDLTSTKAATITITPPTYYENDNRILTDNDYTSANCDKFEIEPNHNDTWWTITETGVLYEEIDQHISIRYYENESDIEVPEPVINGTTVIFTAPSGYTNYTWKIDNIVPSENEPYAGITVSNEGKTLTLNMQTWTNGWYDITLRAQKDGNRYSYHAQIEKM